MDAETQGEVILGALERQDLLTSWEWDFINNIADLIEDSGLTENQIEILYQIQEKLEA